MSRSIASSTPTRASPGGRVRPSRHTALTVQSTRRGYHRFSEPDATASQLHCHPAPGGSVCVRYWVAQDIPHRSRGSVPGRAGWCQLLRSGGLSAGWCCAWCGLRIRRPGGSTPSERASQRPARIRPPRPLWQAELFDIGLVARRRSTGCNARIVTNRSACVACPQAGRVRWRSIGCRRAGSGRG
jgi:hypothetical protein